MFDRFGSIALNTTGLNSNPYNLFSENINSEKDIFCPVGSDSLFTEGIVPIDTNFKLFFDNDFMSSLMLFNLFTKKMMTLKQQSEIITTNFNTNTNLPALKSVYNAELGNTFANIANKNARSTGTIGKCLKGVRLALDWAGLHKGGSMGASAYQAVGNLSNNKNFKQVQVSRNDLKNLPAGCIIVWNRTSKNPHGHIAVTLGNGKEASDHVQNLITNMNASFTVFAPTKGQIA
ncbi:MAG TPA: hypothetical protein PKI94_08335 [Candidatus Gastranaerophilaceae bacterium]|nr:hypothetical protein [Candidatus Gastranaerophilaceae bacterium]